MATTTHFRKKTRDRYYGMFINPLGLEKGLVVNKDDTLVLMPRFLHDRFEYTYNGLKKTFNTCDRYGNALFGFINQKRISLYSDPTIGWRPGSDLWVKPTRLNKNAKWQVLFNPKAPPVMEDYSGKLQARSYDAALACKGLAQDNHMNIVRSAFELRDTKQTLQGIRALLDWAVKAGRGRIKPLATMFEVAAAYLTYQFGIAPTVKDVKQFISEISSQKLRIIVRPRLIKYGEVFRAAYRLKASDEHLTSLCGIKQNVFEQSSTGWIGSNGVWTVYDTSYMVRPTIPLLWKTNLSKVIVQEYGGVLFARANRRVFFNETENRLRTMEWSCPVAKTYWDLTPFTFLLDWFINVGEIIERLEKINLVARDSGYLSQVWHSANSALVERAPMILCSGKVSLQSVPVAGQHPVWNIQCTNRAIISRWWDDGISKEFHRHPYVESLSALLPTLQWPVSAYQLSTGAALIVNLSRNLKRFRG